jgi:hypothetical protein
MLSALLGFLWSSSVDIQQWNSAQEQSRKGNGNRNSGTRDLRRFRFTRLPSNEYRCKAVCREDCDLPPVA